MYFYSTIENNMKLILRFLENRDLKKILSDKHIRLIFGTIIAFLVASWIYVMISFSSIPDRIILHVDSEHIVDMVGTRGELYGVVGVWSFVLLANIALSFAAYKQKHAFAYIMLYGTCAMALLLFVYVWLISLLNT